MNSKITKIEPREIGPRGMEHRGFSFVVTIECDSIGRQVLVGADTLLDFKGFRVAVAHQTGMLFDADEGDWRQQVQSTWNKPAERTKAIETSFGVNLGDVARK